MKARVKLLPGQVAEVKRLVRENGRDIIKEEVTYCSGKILLWFCQILHFKCNISERTIKKALSQFYDSGESLSELINDSVLVERCLNDLKRDGIDLSSEFDFLIAREDKEFYAKTEIEAKRRKRNER